MDKNNITFDQGKYLFEIGASSKDIKGTVSARMEGKLISSLKTVVADCGVNVMRKNSTAQANVTAAMIDDSFFDINKAKVVYVSNNSNVVSVNETGLITAKGTGVATITAYVTIDGNTKSDSFPIKVMPDLKPTSITVNGKEVADFNTDVHSYSYLLNTSSSLPKVEANSSGPDISVDVIQAVSIPGTVIVTLTDKITLEKNLYSINVGNKSVDEEFNSGKLGKQWTWVRENSDSWSLSKKKGTLTITTKEGDLQEAINNAQNILLQNANTDWTIESKVMFSRKPSGFSQNGGLVAYQDDDNFVKLVYGAGGMGFGRPGGSQDGSVLLVAEDNGNPKNVAALNMAGIIHDDNTLYLKLEKKGEQYTASCSADGKDFQPVGNVKLILKDIKAGVMACEGTPDKRMLWFLNREGAQKQQVPQTPFEMSVDYFHIKNSGTK
jgi:beta-glucosidase